MWPMCLTLLDHALFWSPLISKVRAAYPVGCFSGWDIAALSFRRSGAYSHQLRSEHARDCGAPNHRGVYSHRSRRRLPRGCTVPGHRVIPHTHLQASVQVHAEKGARQLGQHQSHAQHGGRQVYPNDAVALEVELHVPHLLSAVQVLLELLGLKGKETWLEGKKGAFLSVEQQSMQVCLLRGLHLCVAVWALSYIAVGEHCPSVVRIQLDCL